MCVWPLAASPSAPSAYCGGSASFLLSLAKTPDVCSAGPIETASARTPPVDQNHWLAGGQGSLGLKLNMV